MKILTLIFMIAAIVGCSSDKPNNSSGTYTLDPQLNGKWEGHYKLTYYFNTDSAYNRETDIWFEFDDTSFYYTCSDMEDDPCGTFGRGSYFTKGDELHLRDELPRIDLCSWENILSGNFQFTFDQNGSHVSLEGWKSVYHYQVKLTRIRHHRRGL